MGHNRRRDFPHTLRGEDIQNRLFHNIPFKEIFLFVGFLAALAKPPIAAAVIIMFIPMPPRAGNPYNGFAAVAAKGFASQQVFYFRLVLSAFSLVLLYAFLYLVESCPVNQGRTAVFYLNITPPQNPYIFFTL
nr:hypothetical protein [Anaerotruncus colihominis]